MTEALKPLRNHKIKHILQGAALFAALAALIHFAFETERDRIEQNLRTKATLNKHRYFPGAQADQSDGAN